jgi:putative intracellular protease/amidase
MGSVLENISNQSKKKRRKEMKRIMIILMISLSILMSSRLTKAADTPKVLLILPNVADPNYLDTVLNKEVSVMKSMLENAGFKVVAATTDGLPIKSSTVSFTPDLKLSDVKVDDYVGVIIACMGSGERTPVFPEAISIVKQAFTQGKPVAASHSSVNVLAEAEVLAGKRYAFRIDGQFRNPKYTGAIYSGSGVVQDGNIITCGICPVVSQSEGLPECNTELTQALITALSPKK